MVGWERQRPAGKSRRRDRKDWLLFCSRSSPEAVARASDMKDTSDAVMLLEVSIGINDIIFAPE